MRRYDGVCCALACTMLLAASGAYAQDPAPPPPVDPAAMTALDRMGAYLRTLNVLRVEADVVTERVLTDGQKVQSSHDVQLLAVRPDRLLLNVEGEHTSRTFLYDGSSFTLWAPRLRYYATVPAPKTILELAVELEDKYDVELPLVDLFRWGTSDAQDAAITGAADLGPSQVDGVTCQHYAFRQQGLDWQIWIQNGDFPLPRKVVLTTTTDDARPQHSSVYTWDLAPSYNDAAFVFTPPADAKRITIAEVQAQRAERNRQEPRQ